MATGLRICVGFYFVEGPICKFCKLQLLQSEPGRQPGFILSLINNNNSFTIQKKLKKIFFVTSKICKLLIDRVTYRVLNET